MNRGKKETLLLQEALAEMRSGMDDSSLMRKYGLSPKEVEELHTVLSAGNPAGPPVSREKTAEAEDQIQITWRCPACGHFQATRFETCPMCLPTDLEEPETTAAEKDSRPHTPETAGPSLSLDSVAIVWRCRSCGHGQESEFLTCPTCGYTIEDSSPSGEGTEPEISEHPRLLFPMLPQRQFEPVVPVVRPRKSRLVLVRVAMVIGLVALVGVILNDYVSHIVKARLEELIHRKMSTQELPLLTYSGLRVTPLLARASIDRMEIWNHERSRHLLAEEVEVFFSPVSVITAVFWGGLHRQTLTSGLIRKTVIGDLSVELHGSGLGLHAHDLTISGKQADERVMLDTSFRRVILDGPSFTRVWRLPPQARRLISTFGDGTAQLSIKTQSGDATGSGQVQTPFLKASFTAEGEIRGLTWRDKLRDWTVHHAELVVSDLSPEGTQGVRQLEEMARKPFPREGDLIKIVGSGGGAGISLQDLDLVIDLRTKSLPDLVKRLQ